MGLSDIHTLTGQAVDALGDDYPPDLNLTLQQKLRHAIIAFLSLQQSYDEEISKNQNGLYPQEAADLYIKIKSLLENLKIDESDDPHEPSVVIDEDEAQVIKIKMVRLHELIETKFNAVDRLEDSYYQ